jgi:hypothetical protein
MVIHGAWPNEEHVVSMVGREGGREGEREGGKEGERCPYSRQF